MISRLSRFQMSGCTDCTARGNTERLAGKSGGTDPTVETPVRLMARPSCAPSRSCPRGTGSTAFAVVAPDFAAAAGGAAARRTDGS